MAKSVEQRNAYLGDLPRPYVSVTLRGKRGSVIELELVADTGSPYALVIGTDVIREFHFREAADVFGNFGWLEGGWMKLSIPGVEWTGQCIAYGSDAVVESTRKSSSRFDGLFGLPLLRKFEYGGNASWFWLRTPTLT